MAEDLYFCDQEFICESLIFSWNGEGNDEIMEGIIRLEEQNVSKIEEHSLQEARSILR